jgi:uncharacterized protein
MLASIGFLYSTCNITKGQSGGPQTSDLRHTIRDLPSEGRRLRSGFLSVTLFLHPSLALAGVHSLMSETQMPSARTRVVREPHRGVYDREAVYQILDEAFLCHVGFAVEGQPFVIPTSYGRQDANLYIHGSAASRMLRQMKDGLPVCVTVTLIDGLVLARSVFNHSMNYRSVVILGKATLVDEPQEKLAALRVLSEHIVPGRWDDVRQPSDKELKATSVLRVPIEEFSAKVRTGPPIDDEEDYSFPTWAGVLPLELKTGEPSADTRLDRGREVPSYIHQYARKR